MFGVPLRCELAASSVSAWRCPMMHACSEMEGQECLSCFHQWWLMKPTRTLFDTFVQPGALNCGLHLGPNIAWGQWNGHQVSINSHFRQHRSTEWICNLLYCSRMHVIQISSITYCRNTQPHSCEYNIVQHNCIHVALLNATHTYCAHTGPRRGQHKWLK